MGLGSQGTRRETRPKLQRTRKWKDRARPSDGCGLRATGAPASCVRLWTRQVLAGGAPPGVGPDTKSLKLPPWRHGCNAFPGGLACGPLREITRGQGAPEWLCGSPTRRSCASSVATRCGWDTTLRAGRWRCWLRISARSTACSSRPRRCVAGYGTWACAESGHATSTPTRNPHRAQKKGASPPPEADAAPRHAGVRVTCPSTGPKAKLDEFLEFVRSEFAVSVVASDVISCEL